MSAPTHDMIEREVEDHINIATTGVSGHHAIKRYPALYVPSEQNIISKENLIIM